MESSSQPILRLAIRILKATAVISLVVVVAGLILRWNEPPKFSNGFFAAGAILIIASLLTVTGGFTQRSNFGVMYAETAGQANSAERGQRMAAEITQRYGTFIFLVVTGLVLIGISIAIGEFLL